MKKRSLFVLLIASISMIFLMGCLTKDVSAMEEVSETSMPMDQEPLSLTVLHLNDTHSHLDADAGPKLSLMNDGGLVRTTVGGIARAAQAVADVRAEKENVLFAHAGDMVQGTLYYTIFNGEADSHFYNMMNLDVMTVGNHEFDRGSEALASLIEMADFPIISANMDVSRDSLLANKVEPYIIKEYNGVPVGIIGLITPTTPNISSPSDDIEFMDPTETAQMYIDQLEAEGINIIILLSHTGWKTEIAMAEALDGVDIILGGHSHTLLGDFEAAGMPTDGPYPVEKKDMSGNTVLVAQTGDHGHLLGRLDVDFDEKGIISSYQAKPLLLLSDNLLDNDKNPLEGEILDQVMANIAANPYLAIVDEDAAYATDLAEYSLSLDVFKNEIIGMVPVELKHVRVPDESLPEGSMIAPLVCDGMLWEAREMGIAGDIAIQNAGGVRVDVPEGEFSAGKAYELMPFANQLASLEMTGMQVKTVLEDALSGIFDDGSSSGAFPYVAGMRYWAIKEAAEGSRITKVEILDTDNTYKAMDMNATYTVITNAYIAGGKDSYDTFGTIEFYDTGFIDAEVFMDYVRNIEVLEPVEQRVFYSVN